MTTRLFPFLIALLLMLAPLVSQASSQGESLKDDVFAMIATSEILNTILVIDTSEQTNAFAYSGYIDTCADAKSKLSKSISMCWQAYNDCAETNANLMCGASLDCSSTLQKCQTLEANKIKLNTFCALVEGGDRYGEPGRPDDLVTEDGCDPASDPNSRACRFIGPWDPHELYEHDLCFYDWASDTGADIPDTVSGSYSQYPNDPDTPDGPDRRDWLCISDDGSKKTRSGLWLNWRFATSLDAIKILLADDHRFSYAPHFRGSVTGTCRTRQWSPSGEGDKCWEYLDYTALSEAGKDAFQALVKQDWTSKIIAPDNGITSEALCTDFALITGLTETSIPSNHADAQCKQCFDKEGAATSCDEEKTLPFSNQPSDPAPVSFTVSNLRSGCRVFHCATPKCRDDVDTHCYSGISPDPSCPLGFYSEWDQDPEHCCDPVGSGFDCVEDTGVGGGSSFMPGPSTQTYIDRETQFPMQLITGAQFYSLAELEAGATTTVACTTDAECTAHADNYSLCDTTAGSPGVCLSGSVWRITGLPNIDRLESAKVEMYYGCKDGSAQIKFFEETYTPDAVNDVVMGALSSAVPISGCDTKGYKVRIRLWVVHDDDDDGTAAAQIDAQLRLTYTWVNPSVLDVFRPKYTPYPTGLPFYYFEGHSWEQTLSGPSQIVKEYECETTFYRMRSKVVSGGGGSCDTQTCDAVGGCNHPYPECLTYGDCRLPYAGCTHKDIIAIGKDQWGSVTKSLCTWLCPDAPEYDDVWKCMGYFEANDSLPYPNGGTGPRGDDEGAYLSQTPPPLYLDRVPCRPGENTVFECCRGLSEFAANYQILETFDTNYYENLSDATKFGNYKCGMAHYQEGIANNERRKTGGISVQITKGHINEQPEGGAYLLTPLTNAFYGLTKPTPYAPGGAGTGWYSPYTLPNLGSSAISSSNISVFKTGENGTRDTACIYNIVQDLYGEDCDTCGMGCCMVDMGDIDYCSFPSFWIKVAKTKGGNIVLPLPAGHPDNSSTEAEAPSPLVGAALTRFKDRIVNLRGVGGATVGETLYDAWRYLGGLKPAYTDRDLGFATYQSPIQANPHCFINNAVVISGGQPNFDSNTAMDGSTANFGGAMPSPVPTYPPYVEESTLDGEPLSTGTPSETRPYYVENWYKTSLPEVAAFVHNTDAYYYDDATGGKDCREGDPANYRFGFDYLNAAPCLPANDTSGDNVIERIDTVGIGSWALAPIYAIAGNDTGYLDADDIMVTAAQGEGKFYGLTASATVSNDQQETFVNLSQIFNSLSEEYPGTFSVGKPHWTSSPVQPLGKYQEAANSVALLPSVVPVSQRLSRFWLGNLKKYYAWSRKSSGTGGSIGSSDIECILGRAELAGNPDAANCEWLSFDNEELKLDCFNPSTADVTGGTEPAMTEYNKVLSGGIAKNLAGQVKTCAAPPCYQSYQSCSWSSSGQCRIIYTDNGTALENFADKTKAELNFGSGITSDDAATILDYIYGHDSVDHDGDGDRGENRGLLTLEGVNDPFTSGQKIDLPYSILGAAVHSKPLAVYYGDDSTEANLRIYYGANDGLLHCFDGIEGEAGSTHASERWAYMPSKVRPEMQFILSGLDAVSFNSTIDGPLTLFHKDTNVDGFINNGEKAFLIIAYRRGVSTNSAYTVLDISVKDAPVLIDHYNITGQSWSAPAVFRMGANYYLAFGGGYDPYFDEDNPSCVVGSTCPVIKGKRIHVYAYNNNDAAPDFTEVARFCPTGDADAACTVFNDWLVAPVAAEPIAVNTNGPVFTKSGGVYTGNTEMLYFVDVTGTIFRVTNNSGWAIQPVMTMRDAANTLSFSEGVRSYYSFLPAPKYEQFVKVQVDAGADGNLSGADDVFLVPVPLVTGNLVLPRETGMQYEIVVLYDPLPNPPHALPGSITLPARYATAPFIDMTARATVHSFFNGASALANLYRGYRINLRPNAFTSLSGTSLSGEKGLATPLVYYNWDYGSYALFATTYATETGLNECSNSGESFLYCRNLPTGDTLQLDERYAKCMACDVIGLGEGLAQTPQPLKGIRQPNDEVVVVAVGANLKTESNDPPPPPKTIKILKWYELY